jgi:hypothetical protein
MFGDKNFIATKDDEIYFPRHLPHAFQNIGSEAGKTLWTVIPGSNFEEFFDKLSALPVGAPDLQRVRQLFVRYGM